MFLSLSPFFQASLYRVCSTALNANIPLILIDGFLLSSQFVCETQSYCQVLCQDQRLTRLAAIGEFVDHHKLSIFVKELRDSGLTVIEHTDLDPHLLNHDFKVTIPLHLLIYKHEIASPIKKHVIQISFLYERLSKYWWIAKLNLPHYDKALMLKQDIRKADFVTSDYDIIMDKFETKNTIIDGILIGMPKNNQAFIESTIGSVENLAFIDCNMKRAKEFKKQYRIIDEKSDNFRTNVRNLLYKVKIVLDELDIPFWLSSGTCLGYYRQCDIIPYTSDVDIGIFARNYRPEIIDKFFLHGMPLLHIFGKPEDSFELSFRDGNIKLDIFFFYEDDFNYWNGGTDSKTGQKYKYIFPKFNLCWSQFLSLLLRVPCDSEAYIMANYGINWSIPIETWDWKTSPSNVKPNGRWLPEEYSNVIQLTPTSDHI